MRKIKKSFLSTLVVLIFLLSIGTSINAIDIEKSKEGNNFSSCDLSEKFLQENGCTCKLLNGKYAVMTDRITEPKTFIPDEEPLPTASFDNLPSQFCWNNYNGDWMTPVEEQGNCGSCWAFSALCTMQSQINLASGYPDTDIDLSVQYVLSCLPYGGSCNGGWTDDAFEAIISDSPSIGNGINGVPLESCMPYQEVDYIPCSDKCDDWDTYSVPPNENDILWQMEDWGANHNFENDDPGDRDIVKSWIMDKGPLSVSMYASSSFSSYWNAHHNSDDWYYEEDHGYTNHAVVLCGWVDDQDVTNGGYWILQNSWGTDWGYGGYFNAAYGGQDIGEIVRWCKTFDWPVDEQGPGPGDIDMHVFSNFDYIPDYPHPDEELDFTDMSDGQVVLWEWDFDGDGVIDSNSKRPSWTYTTEGEYDVTLTVWSTWGLSSNRTRTIQVKENWPPEVDGLPVEMVDDEMEYHFEGRYCSDPDGSIVSYLWDFDDGTTSDEAYLYHTFPEPDKIYEVTLTVTDNDGGSSSGLCKVKIDQTVPPITQIHHSGELDDSDWYSETQKIYFSATDWKKVISTYYRVDGGSWARYGASSGKYTFVSSEGEHTVEAYSVDFYGNEEYPVSNTFSIDKTEPTADISLSGNEDDGWYLNKVTVTISENDDFSGVDKVFYRYKTMDWMEYNAPFVIDDRTGQFPLYVIVLDNAGNQGLFEKEIFIKNIYGPTIPEISGPTKSSPGKDLTYNIISYDPGNTISYYIEWGDGESDDWFGSFDSGEEIQQSHSFDSTGTFIVKVKAKNQFDIESEWGTINVRMPKSMHIFNFLFEFLQDYPLVYNLLKAIFYR